MLYTIFKAHDNFSSCTWPLSLHVGLQSLWGYVAYFLMTASFSMWHSLSLSRLNLHSSIMPWERNSSSNSPLKKLFEASLGVNSMFGIHVCNIYFWKGGMREHLCCLPSSFVRSKVSLNDTLNPWNDTHAWFLVEIVEMLRCSVQLTLRYSTAMTLTLGYTGGAAASLSCTRCRILPPRVLPQGNVWNCQLDFHSGQSGTSNCRACI